MSENVPAKTAAKAAAPKATGNPDSSSPDTPKATPDAPKANPSTAKKAVPVKAAAEKQTAKAETRVESKPKGKSENEPDDIVVVQGNAGVFADVEDAEAYTPPKDAK